MKILKLVKIGKKENIDKLISDGQLYFNTVDFFRKNDENDFKRGDYAEALKYTPIKNFRFADNEFKDYKIKNTVFKEYNDVSHIYSLYMLDESFWLSNKSIDQRMSGFGDSVLVIKPKEFLERVLSCFPYKINYSPVKYYETPLIPSKVDSFSKRKEFSYQNEFRFTINEEILTPIPINIGSLSDISEMISVESFMKIRFK